MNEFSAQIRTLPALITEVHAPFCAEAARVFTPARCAGLTRLHTMGCGDSYFAALGSELAFEMLGGLQTRAQNAMSFARYSAPFLKAEGALLIGISVSGGVTRTIEGMRRAAARGLATVAITSSGSTPIAAASQEVLTTRVPDLPNAAGVQVPGARSYVASLMMLYASAIAIGQSRGVLTTVAAADWRAQLRDTAQAAERAIALADEPARQLAHDTLAYSGEFVFCGSGPNFGSAQFCAAKMLEATGDPALGQDVEEWAHLQYFARTPDTPTFMISAGERDASRAAEVRTAMQALGRRVIALPCAPCPEVFAPLLSAIPAMLFAAERAALLGEPYFRAFGGGRSIEHGGGISRIRTSELVDLDI